MYHYRNFIPKLTFLLQAEGMYMKKCCQDFALRRGKFSTSLLHQWSKTRDRHYTMADHVRRCLVASETDHDSSSQTEILTFVKSTLHKLEGPNHYWLNDIGGSTKSIQDGVYLVLVISVTKDQDMVGYRERAIMFYRVKFLQQRYPELNVLALCCGSVDSISNHVWIVEAIMEEYVTFPILMLKKDCMKMANHVGLLLSKGFSHHFVHFNLDVELGVVAKAIEEYSPSKKETIRDIQNTSVDETRQQDILKEPSFYPFRNLLLYYPGSVSVDEDGNRIFISDSNHHRIIISSGEGKILDCIGSSPGFEDGDFESAKLFRPAGSFYHPGENCLYFVDSENHAIRRADMEKRVLETFYPACVQKSSSVWSWILDKLGLGTEVASQEEQLDLDLIKFPWYLMKTRENDLLTIDHSFETLWVLSMETGEIKQVIRGFSNIVDICEELIMEKVTLLKDTYQNMSSKRFHQSFSFEGIIAFAGLLSSIASFQNDVIFCDAASQRIFRYHRESKGVSYLQFSNLRVLGLPYWMVCPLERVVDCGNTGSFRSEHLRNFNVLPGRCDIHFFVDIPQGTELVAPVDERCIWCQIRGSAAELSGSNGSVAGAEKVGVAQQWFDELDNLAFSKMEDETSCQDGEELLESHIQDKDRVHFDCSINISPGSAEVVVSAVVYLKVKKTQGNAGELSLIAMKVLDYNKHETRKQEEDTFLRLLSEAIEDVEDMIFMKPLHIRLRLGCADHPPAETNRETICTDSTINVTISMD